MSQTNKNGLLHEQVSFRKASVNDVNILIDIIGDYYQKLNLSESAKQKGQSALDLDVRSERFIHRDADRTTISGFFIARHIKLNSHLHTFFC